MITVILLLYYYITGQLMKKGLLVNGIIGTEIRNPLDQNKKLSVKNVRLILGGKIWEDQIIRSLMLWI